MKLIKPIIFGCKSTALEDDEKDFFAKENPLGLILFDKNVQNPKQLKQLINSFRKCVGREDAPILVDQEGGRVQRLHPPFWTKFPFAKTYGDKYQDLPEIALTELENNVIKMARELYDVGINTNCWPCLDVLREGTNPVLGERCFSSKPEVVNALSEKVISTFIEHHIMPIIKHIPGYGLAKVDPHKELPIVSESLSLLERIDFDPFKRVNLPIWGMIAHVIYTSIDCELPATISPIVIDYIRKEIGFQGFMISDDIAMGALKMYGSIPEIAQKCINSGCDCVLYCATDSLNDMKKVSDSLPYLSELSTERLEKGRLILQGRGQGCFSKQSIR